MNSAPVVLSPKYVLAFTAYYSIGAVWGMVASFNGLVSIQRTGGMAYEAIWTLAVFAVSAVLAVLTVTNFQRIEKWFTLAWVMIVSAYPAAIVYQWLAVGDDTKAAPSISTFLYLVFPTARYIYLIWKTKSNG